MKRFPKRDINKLVHALQSIQGIDAAIVYGSIARGDYGPSSDIDVLLILDTLETEDIALDLLAGLELNRAVQPIVRTRKQLEATDSGLVENIFQEGMVLFARVPLNIPAASILDVHPWVLYRFELTDLPQKEKARFNRQLYSSTKHNGSGGLLGELGGKRLARGCVVVPASAQKRIDALFRRFRVQARGMDIWM